MATLFLSYSSRDKKAVVRLAKALKMNGISVWLDEMELDVGDALVEKIQNAIKDAKFVAVWLTSHSVNSGWVTKEWGSRLCQEISSKSIAILPLLAEDCDVPFFLSDKKFADFRTSFDDGLAALLRALNKRIPSRNQPESTNEPSTISDSVHAFFHDLEDARIAFPTISNLDLVKALKAIPRSGKFLRLQSMVPSIPIRSIYDHILSLGHSADCLLPELAPGIEGRDRVELARTIAYHDICEVVIGDIPQYTRLTDAKRKRARVTAEMRMSQMPEGEPERITNAFIGMFLPDSERQSLVMMEKIMAGDSPVKRFCVALDKIDPIIATWRYVHHFRKAKGFSIREFIRRMRHFFENPRVKAVVEEYVNDKRLVKLVDELQTPENARRYFTNKNLLTEGQFSLPGNVLRRLIEGRHLEFVSETPSHRQHRPPRSRFHRR